MSEGNKSPLNRVIQPIETKNCYSPLETEENLAESGNSRTYQVQSNCKIKCNKYSYTKHAKLQR